MFFCEEQKKKTTVNNSVYYTFAALGEKKWQGENKNDYQTSQLF